MKTKLIFTILILIPVIVVMAIPIVSFQGWDWTMEHSPDIIVARCIKTPVQSGMDGEVRSDIETICVLKGKSGLGTNILRSLYWPRQGEYYLIFSDDQYGSHQAFEEYRIIPLGVEFTAGSIAAIAGKPLGDQVRTLFQRRLDNLNRQMEKEQEEKQRLEEGLEK